MSENENVNKEVIKKEVAENTLDYLFELHSKGIPISEDNLKLLEKKGYFKNDTPLPKKEKEEKKDIIFETQLNFSSPKQKEIDKNIDIVFGDIPDFSEFITTEEKESSPQEIIFEGGRTITQKDWLPESTTKHTQEFINWIDSINSGFSRRSTYKKFQLYVQQSNQWLEEKSDDSDYSNSQDLKEYRLRELSRCYENTLYFLNKYVYYKKGGIKNKKTDIKYSAYPVHEIMCYLNDAGYSVIIAKARQIAATTTLLACDLKDAVFRRNYFMKFITENQTKAEEFFEDKLKYPFSMLPWWMRPNVLNERDNMFKLGHKEEKGDRKGVNSSILVVPPTRTAVAGGSPNKTKIDEGGNIGILGEILSNLRPTMLKFDEETKTLEMEGQVWVWGTGGEMEKGGKAFETEFMSIMKNWEEGNYQDCIIPLFFDWTARPGATQQIYDDQKFIAYSKVGPDAKKSRIEFHQSWPNNLGDVFKTSGKTLVDDEYIDASIKRIDELNAKHGRIYKYGWFEPEYDLSKPTDEGSDVPYKIIGANFVPSEGPNDPRNSVTIFMDPVPNWKNRYYLGTDPISSDTGVSNMATAVWDKHFKTISAMLDFRVKDVRQIFLQCLLLGIYYNTDKTKKTAMELLESNIGQAYTQYRINKGFAEEMVVNHELPDFLQNHSALNEGIGIDNKGQRNVVLVNRLQELIMAYGDRIHLKSFWTQTKTFVYTVSATGKNMWGPQNKKYFTDDELWAALYAYICGELCFPEQVPKCLDVDKQKTKIVYRLKYDKDYNQRRVPVRVPA